MKFELQTKIMKLTYKSRDYFAILYILNKVLVKSTFLKKRTTGLVELFPSTTSEELQKLFVEHINNPILFTQATPEENTEVNAFLSQRANDTVDAFKGHIGENVETVKLGSMVGEQYVILKGKGQKYVELTGLYLNNDLKQIQVFFIPKTFCHFICLSYFSDCEDTMTKYIRINEETFVGLSPIDTEGKYFSLAELRVSEDQINCVVAYVVERDGDEIVPMEREDVDVDLQKLLSQDVETLKTILMSKL